VNKTSFQHLLMNSLDGVPMTTQQRESLKCAAISAHREAYEKGLEAGKSLGRAQAEYMPRAEDRAWKQGVLDEVQRLLGLEDD
jgi:hypothetical protein